jgi:hypothetical protein
MDIFPPSLVLYTRRLGIRVPLGALEKPLFHGVFRIYDLYMAAHWEIRSKKARSCCQSVVFFNVVQFSEVRSVFRKVHLYPTCDRIYNPLTITSNNLYIPAQGSINFIVACINKKWPPAQ